MKGKKSMHRSSGVSIIKDLDDMTRHSPATAAGGNEHRNDAFKQQLREQLSQLEVLKGVPYIISLAGGSSTALRLPVQNGDVLIFDDITDVFAIEHATFPVIISLLY